MWCVQLSMLMAVPALRDMQGAADHSVESTNGLESSDVSGGDGM